MFHLTRLYSSGQISKENFLETLKKISEYLDESFACLKDEPEGTKESTTAKLAKKALTQTKEIILFSDFI